MTHILQAISERLDVVDAGWFFSSWCQYFSILLWTVMELGKIKAFLDFSGKVKLFRTFMERSRLFRTLVQRGGRVPAVAMDWRPPKKRAEMKT